MSAIRAYLESKAKLPEREWLRREPRETHPAILDAVRDALRLLKPSRGGTIYDDDVERFVNVRAGDLPSHMRHGLERGRLLEQLGHEVYIARGVIRDEAETAEIMTALERGYVPLGDASIVDGGRYLIRVGTLFSGYQVPVYGEPREVRARLNEHGLPVFARKGARTWHALAGPALVKPC